MTSYARYEGRRRLRGSVYLSIAMSALAAMVIWVYPSFSEAFESDELLDAYPPEIMRIFNIETMSSLEGFLSFELYVFGWVILLGLYVAYLAAGSMARGVERGEMDILLALPISRARLVLESVSSLLVPISLANVIPAAVVYVGSVAIGEQLALADLVMIHLLSIPYLTACAGIGLLASVLADRADIAQRLALGVVFGLYLMESLIADTEYEVLGVIAPSRYYNTNEILIQSSYDILGAVILLWMTLVLLLASVMWFRRRDI